jgi:hypothetical protein
VLAKKEGIKAKGKLQFFSLLACFLMNNYKDRKNPPNVIVLVLEKVNT